MVEGEQPTHGARLCDTKVKTLSNLSCFRKKNRREIGKRLTKSKSSMSTFFYPWQGFKIMKTPTHCAFQAIHQVMVKMWTHLFRDDTSLILSLCTLIKCLLFFSALWNNQKIIYFSDLLLCFHWHHSLSSVTLARSTVTAFSFPPSPV